MALILLGINYSYPFSILSIKKSITYNPDDIVVEEFLHNLNDFKGDYSREQQGDLTANRTQYILTMYEQKWISSKEPVKINVTDLDSMLLEVKSTRQTLMELAFQENYSTDTRILLKYTIESCLAIEDSILDLKNSQSHSRKTLVLQYQNLHVSFINNFNFFVSFYEEYRKNS